MTTRWIPLGKVCDIVSGSTPKRDQPAFWGGSIAWATPKDLSSLDGPILHDTTEHITRAGYESCSTTMLPRGAVLFSSRAPIGLVAVAGREMCTNQGFKSLVPGQHLDSGYLYHCMKANKETLNALGNGATFKEVSKAVVSRFEIPVPPLTEQMRIAAILDKSDAVRRKRKEALRLTQELSKSVFLDIFGDPSTNPKRWDVKPLGDLCKVKSGAFLPAKAMDPEGTFPVYGGNGINGRHSEYMFEESKIAIGRVGVYCGVVHITEPRSWITDNALYVSEFDDTQILPGYLAEALRMVNLNRVANQAAQPLISAGRIYPVRILVPPLEVQERYLGFSAGARRAGIREEQALAESENLYNSLSQEFFAPGGASKKAAA